MTEFNPGGASSLNEAVKLRYEANPDTNAFTDADRTKLDGIAPGATANASDAQLRDRATHTGTQAISTVTGLQAALDGKAGAGHSHAVGDVTGLQALLDGKASATHGHDAATAVEAGFLTAADKTKLDGIAPGATANASDAQLRDRATHTGEQAVSTVTGLQAALDGKAAASHTHTASAISDSTAAGRSMLTAASASAQTALLDTFTADAKGLVPASGGGTTNFLRADGMWTAPPAGGGSGDVAGPVSAADNAIARFDGGTGKLIQGSGVTLSDDGELVLPLVPAPAAPAGDHVGLFGRRIAGRMMPAFIGPSGLDSALQPLLARNNVVLWQASGNGSVITSWGASFAATGTATARNVAATNLFTRMRRVGYPTAATAGSLGGTRISATQYTLGTGPDGNGISLGGFTMICRFGMQAVSASYRMFVGMVNSAAAPANVNPATRTQQVGVARIDGSNNLHIVFGGTAAQTPIDLGSDFPATTVNTDFYEVGLFAPPGITETVGWQVTRLNTGHVASGTLTGSAAVLPSATTLLAFNSWITNNTDAVAVGIDWASIYLEKDI
jgi:hypothetical protein